MLLSKDDESLQNIHVGSKEINAARIAFFIPGFIISTWAPMIPIIKHRLSLEADVLGLLLLCIGLSAFFTMPVAGILGKKFGCKKVMLTASVIMSLVMVTLSVLPNTLSYAIALVIFGSSMGVMDVNMNVNAVIVEKIADKRLLSGMHAFWSIGCFASAGLFSLLATMGLAVTTIAILHCAIIFTILFVFSPYFLSYKSPGGEKAVALPKGIVIFFGILACICFLAEGAVMDWSGVFITEVKNVDLALAGAGYAIFSVAMLIMRLLGDKTVQKIGERKAVIGGSLLAAASFALLVWADNLYLSAIAFVGIGLCSANIVPVLYSLLKFQKDMPISAAVTAITSLGYTGVILGPAALGFIAHGFGITAVFELLALLMLLEAIIAAYVFKRIAF